MRFFMYITAIAILFLSDPLSAQTWKLVSPGGGSDGNGVSCMPPWGGEDGFIAHGTGITAFKSADHLDCVSQQKKIFCVNGVIPESDVYKYKNCAGACTLDGVTKNNGGSHEFYSAANHPTCTGISQVRTCVQGAFDGDNAYSKAACISSPCPDRGNAQGFGTFSCYCSAARYSENGSVWGTGYYTSDSTVCRAARHAGKLTAQGGAVTYTVTTGHSSYTGTTANGVTSSSYGSYSQSFSFP